MIIAIDGPAGTGKSVISRMIAKKFDFQFLNTGLFYRALTYQVQQIYKTQYLENIDLEDICELANNTVYEDQVTQFLVNNENILPFLRTSQIDELITQIAHFAEVRTILNKKIRQSVQKKNIVCEGRDTTTIVFPNADIKIYLTASLTVRAQRRFYQKCSNHLSLQEIISAIIERDKQDTERSTGPLKKAKNAIYIDSSDLTLNEVYEKIVELIRNQT